MKDPVVVWATTLAELVVGAVGAVGAVLVLLLLGINM